MTQVNPAVVNISTANEFIARHIGPRVGDEQAMLNSLGFDSLEALSCGRGTHSPGPKPSLIRRWTRKTLWIPLMDPSRRAPYGRISTHPA